MRALLPLALLLGLLAGPGCGSSAEDAKEVEAVVAAVNAAAAEGDLAAFARIVAPKDRSRLAFDLTFAVSLLFGVARGGEGETDVEDRVNALEDLMEQHGLERTVIWKEDVGPSHFEGLDHAAYLGDLSALIGLEFGDVPALDPAHVHSGELAHLEVAGDEATALVGGKPRRFSRLDGAWYLRVEDAFGAWGE